MEDLTTVNPAFYSTVQRITILDVFIPGDIEGAGENATTSKEITVHAGTIFLIAVLSLIIVATIFGNMLILTAIRQHRPLQTPQNYLIASLAVADLMVGILVMPLSLSKEVVVVWIFGPILCDFWISLDVLCCTASILNLCMISLDRFWAITKPVIYPKYRKPRIMLIMIAIVWLLASIISISPLFGWQGKQEIDPTMCQISQHKIYTIFSTFGAFFIPMTIMMIVYARIFCEARKRIRGKAFHSPVGTAHLEPPPLERYSETHAMQSSHPLNGDPSFESQNGSSLEVQRTLSSSGKTKSVPNFQQKSEESSEGKFSMVTSLSVPGQNGAAHVSVSLSLKEINANTPQTQALLPKSLTPSHSPLPPQFQERERKRRAMATAREQRATKTLGIVTGAFLICWLPFFLRALILPLCNESCYVPRVWDSLFLWLGYFNSMLNPIIYTKFNQDFQRAFKKLLHCKEKTIKK
ncbi:5-hydroxytryptamine receptor 1D-like [Diadema antillarum]|uniref:5-hydroxytryptamine receptor 1D-like n=1 Tax=Diadema antillarum TaxID=105358 RepID=UPI003A862064